MMTPTLADRLETGWRLIDQTRDPTERHLLTDHWLSLIERYQEEQDPMLWNSPGMHEWEPRTMSDAKSPVPSLYGGITRVQGVLANI